MQRIGLDDAGPSSANLLLNALLQEGSVHELRLNAGQCTWTNANDATRPALKYLLSISTLMSLRISRAAGISMMDILPPIPRDFHTAHWQHPQGLMKAKLEVHPAHR